MCRLNFGRHYEPFPNLCTSSHPQQQYLNIPAAISLLTFGNVPLFHFIEDCVGFLIERGCQAQGGYSRQEELPKQDYPARVKE